MVWCFPSVSVLPGESVSPVRAGGPTTTLPAFRTPPRILIPKLVRSRDAWKAKAAARKTQRKALEVRVRDLEASRDLHRQRAEQLRERVRQLEAELADATRPAPAPTTSPKNRPAPRWTLPFRRPPPRRRPRASRGPVFPWHRSGSRRRCRGGRHAAVSRHPLRDRRAGVAAAVGLRPSDAAPVARPPLGLAHRSHAPNRLDQAAGHRRRAPRRRPFCVRPLPLADLHLVAMVPREDSNRECVDPELEKAVARTGVPRQIVADGAADLQTGIERFRARHPQTASVPDAAHRAANLPKHYWESDPRRQAFTRRRNETAAAIRQTSSAYLRAPKLRNKARFMSAGAFVRFGRTGVPHEKRARS